ncbi:Flp family type IVb pilin [Fusibacter sp. JL216-2]|uniref:Flp family type IVb pilin n=1 Tax=Fusibacter sp. JL216-2 TaxID=3071453 RepID=UPI003D327D5D
MMNFIYNAWMALNNKKGQGMVEYVLLIGLIAVAVIAIMITMGTTITAEFQDIINSLTAQ